MALMSFIPSRSVGTLQDPLLSLRRGVGLLYPPRGGCAPEPDSPPSCAPPLRSLCTRQTCAVIQCCCSLDVSFQPVSRFSTPVACFISARVRVQHQAGLRCHCSAETAAWVCVTQPTQETRPNDKMVLSLR